jgi:pyridoxal phosphate enzyme (YggS family)
MMAKNNTIKQNLEELYQRTGLCAEKAGKKREDITLVGVSKTKPAEMLRQAYDAGLRQFGENRVQEYLDKQDKLPGDICWNLIGQLQTNKVKYIIDKNIFLLHSLDRTSLAEEIQKQCIKHDKTLDVLMQVNISREQTKSGFFEEETNAFLEGFDKYDRINLKGLMTIAPFVDDEKTIRGVFEKTRRIFERIAAYREGFTYLSMGMSGDFEWAILEGANMIRVGSAIFGERI